MLTPKFKSVLKRNLRDTDKPIRSRALTGEREGHLHSLAHDTQSISQEPKMRDVQT